MTKTPPATGITLSDAITIAMGQKTKPPITEHPTQPANAFIRLVTEFQNSGDDALRHGGPTQIGALIKHYFSEPYNN